jgi:subtilase family serine protease
VIAFVRRRLLVPLFVVGAAAGLSSAARAQSCVSDVPHITGQWVTLGYQMPINPISATLLRTGQVLIVAGSENDAHNNSDGSESYRAAVWDPEGTTQSSIAVQTLTYDVFCSGTAALPDGRPLVVGGTSDYSFTGDNRASFFDPATGRFVQSQSMVDGRWYATATTLGDGRIMAFSGLKLSGGTNNTVEIYGIGSSGTGWSSPTPPAPFVPPLYPRMALLPNGKVFYTGHGSGGSNANGWMFDPSVKTWTSSVPTTRNRTYGSAVILPLLPPAYTPKVMALGGGGNPATSSTEIIDLSAASPAWTPGPSMSTGRIQMDAVILPDGTVLAMGGSVNNEAPNGPGKTADLYDPVTNTFGSAGTASYSRLYHSTALLLPDARVMSIGSNPGSRGRYEAAIEIYTPAYLFDSSDLLITTGRPSITAVTPSSGVVGYNAPFSVNFSSASPIASAVLVRPGSVTHAFDMDQRLIGLCGPSPQPPCSAGGGTLNLTSPPNGNIAPPGYYMLFLLDSAGVPSKAQFIQLSAHSTSPPPGAIASPVTDVTIPAGGSVVFSTNTTAANYSWIFPGGSPTTSVAQAPGSVIFNVPGTYVTSLTVIDADGNSDPSPPTRTITVTPPTPDFSITSSPPAQVVSPGESTTFTVTVTPITGFAGPVTLTVDSESPFPAGVTSGGFSPASITGSGSSTLTMNTTTSAVPFALSLTVTGTSGALTHTTSTTLLVNLAPPASLTATPGDAQVSLSWPASIGANGYHVKRSRTSGGPYVGIACPTGTSYVDTGLTNGTTYYYVVSASYTGGPDAGGESADSSEASTTPHPPSAQLTVTRTGTGAATSTVTSTPAGIDCGTTCEKTFDTGTVVTLLPAPGATYVFGGWSGDPDCADGVVTLDADKTCSAAFNNRPDLTVSALTAPASAGAGATISVTDTTKNLSGGPAFPGTSNTKIWLSTDAVLDASDTLLGARPVPSLNPLAFSTGATSVVIPAGKAPGSYFLIANADADGSVPESNEGNNVRTKAITVLGPDLQVTALTAPTVSGANRTISITDTTRNATGASPAPASTTTFYLSTDAVWDGGDIPFGSRNVPALAGGAQSALTANQTLPSVANGNYYIIAKADGPLAIAESNETNNTRAKAITIGADLSVSVLGAPAKSGAGLSITVTDTTANAAGRSDVADSTTAYYFSSDAVLGPGDTLLNSRTTGPIPSGGTSASSASVTIPAGATTGTWYIIAKADDPNGVLETLETNNTRSKSIAIGPDLIVLTIAAPLSAHPGQTINVTPTTKNQGGGSSGVSSTTKIYLRPPSGPDTFLGSRTVLPLAPNASSGGIVSVTIPVGTPTGSYNLFVVADDGNAVVETIETNNTKLKAITIN